ncbi:hypothetical protein M9H77_32796 [Catharanthus roseus]|uniref:Uncharacterized protein n=1 Tax=Catharanthus roseus TaxID=4058 RepID=A0ACC0A4S2_CATRO|nr:hypothetical protein M9H77_32796 [Catharanthus roseus]
MAAIATLLCPFKPISISKQKQIHLSAAPKVRVFETKNTKISRTVLCSIFQDQKCVATILGAAGLAALITFVEPTFAAELPGSSLQFNEPSNALSLPTWAIHVSSVAEWVTAMALVWQYGEKPGNESWKGLSWGMVPLLGGAFCACTWHFFYNAESLEILVALQAALTAIGNATMCIAAFRIFKSSQESSKNL